MRNYSPARQNNNLAIQQSQGPSVLPPGLYILSQVLEAVLQVLKPPPGGRSQLYAAHKHVDPRMVGTRRLMMLTPTTSPRPSQENVHEPITPYKTPHYPLQGGGTVREALACCVPSLPGCVLCSLFPFFCFLQHCLHISIWHWGTEAADILATVAGAQGPSLWVMSPCAPALVPEAGE